MKCFTHHQNDAIGICKACGKGICPGCCKELKDGLSCEGPCEKQVELVNKIIDRNEKNMVASNRQVKNTAYFSMASGTLFVILGIYFLDSSVVMGSIFISLGVLYALSGILRMSKKAQYVAPLKSEDKK